MTEFRTTPAGNPKSNCKSCEKTYQAEWATRNREKTREYNRLYKSKNREKVLEGYRLYSKVNRKKKTENWRKWYKNNPKKLAASNLKHRNKQYEWRRNNPEVYAFHAAKRRAAKLKATPPWVDDKHMALIKQMYKTAKTMSEFHEVQFDVDHIEPLQGKNSCGLNVIWNLQILEHSENCSKHNKT